MSIVSSRSLSAALFKKHVSCSIFYILYSIFYIQEICQLFYFSNLPSCSIQETCQLFYSKYLSDSAVLCKKAVRCSIQETCHMFYTRTCQLFYLRNLSAVLYKNLSAVLYKKLAAVLFRKPVICSIQEPVSCSIQETLQLFYTRTCQLFYSGNLSAVLFKILVRLKCSIHRYVINIEITPISWKPEPTCIYSNNPN